MSGILANWADVWLTTPSNGARKRGFMTLVELSERAGELFIRERNGMIWFATS